jgi:uncharacterized protein YoaH (UPF0181 family)
METNASSGQPGTAPQQALQSEFSVENEIQRLMKNGLSRARAEAVVNEVLKTHRQKLFQASFNKQSNDENRKAAFLVAMLASLLGPAMEISSAAWYVAAMAISGAAGWFGYKEKPAAGIAGGVVLAMVLPFTYQLYFTGRSSYIKIELLIPLLMAAIPAYLLLLLIAKLFYPTNELEES